MRWLDWLGSHERFASAVQNLVECERFPLKLEPLRERQQL